MSRQRLTELKHSYKQAMNETVPEENADSARRIALLEEITAMEQNFIEAKKRINAYTPFLRLPRELIGEIATILAYIWPLSARHYNEYSSREDTTIGWISLSHVCQSLRVILLSMPSLWALAIQDLRVTGHLVLLQRARELPISLSVGACQCSHTMETINLTLSLLTFARKVSTRPSDQLCGLLISDWRLYPETFSAKALPLLEEVDIQLDRRAVSQLVLFSNQTFSLPPIVAPRLRRLTLRNFYIPFGGMKCSLAYLNLARTSEHVLPSFSRFLDMLRSCSELQELYLLSWIPDISPLDTGTVSFSSLKLLHIDDACTRCLYFWARVNVPPTTRQVITFIVTPPDRDNYIDAIVTGIASKIRIPTRSLHVSDATGPTNLGFSKSQVSPLQAAQAGDQILSVFDYNDGLLLDIYIQKEIQVPDNWEEGFDNSFHINNSAILQHTLRHCGLASSLELLYLALFKFSIPDLTAHEEMRTLLLPFVNLHTLHLLNSDLVPLICPLTISPSDSALFLPHLRFLWADRLDISGISESSLSTWPGKPDNISKCDFFLEMLRSRARAGIGLERLRIERMECPQGDLAYVQNAILSPIRAIVPHFESEIDGSWSFCLGFVGY